MPNSNATVNSPLIAQTALITLLAKFPILSRIATDFSSASVKFNQDIVTHIVTPTVAKDFVPAIRWLFGHGQQAFLTVVVFVHHFLALVKPCVDLNFG
jgi:hypothetical protein